MMRRLDKRACRRVAGQGWNTDRSRGLFMAKSVEYIVRTAIKTIARQKTLVLYLYDTEFGDPGPLIPSYTVFQGREDLYHAGPERWRFGLAHIQAGASGQ